MRAITGDETAPIRLRLVAMVALLNERGLPSTPAHVADALGISRGQAKSALHRLKTTMKSLVAEHGQYRLLVGEPVTETQPSVTGSQPSVPKTQPSVTIQQPRYPDRDRGTQNATIGTQIETGTPCATRTRDSSQKHIYTYPPTPLPAGDEGGLLAGSDRASPTHIPTLAEGIPMEGSEGGRATGPSAPDEGPLPGWPDFSATTGEPEFPLEWLDGVFNLLREMTPPPRGQRYARPLNQRDQRIVEEHIRGLGGWKRFDELVLPALREAQGVKSPLGWLGWKCKQISKGEAPAEGLRWVPPEYRNEGGGSRTIIAALTSVAWGGRPDPDVQRGAMAWALAHIDDSRVREALCNKIGPSPWATAEVREALARYP